MHSLGLELADTSNAIARTMAEAAAASLLTDGPLAPSVPHPSSPASTSSAAVNAARGNGDAAAPVVEATDAVVPLSVGGVGRSREDAQAEVNRLKARQLKLFELIRDKREVDIRMIKRKYPVI